MQNNKVKSFKNINDELVTILIRKYNKNKVNTKNKRILFFAKYNDVAITIYVNKTLMVQGNSDYFNDVIKVISPFVNVNIDNSRSSKGGGYSQNLPHIKKSKIINVNKYEGSIGCDETGTGDYFGPVVVCACYIKNCNIQKVKNLGVKDSKKLNDLIITNIYKRLIKIVDYRVDICRPKRYNNLISKFENNKILLAFLHNACLIELKKSVKENPIPIIMDEFVVEEKYYSYLKNEIKNNPKTIHVDLFTTKAEEKYLAVAAASIIARAIFLEEMEKLNKKSGMKLILGSTKLRFIIGQGKDIVRKNLNLEDFAKIHFKSITEKIIPAKK